MSEKEIQARKELGNIISYKRQLKQLESKIIMVESAIISKGVAPYSDIGGSGDPKGLENTYIKWIELKMDYESKYADMGRVIRELEEKIYSLNETKAEYAEILSRYYIIGECLESISSDMHYNYDYVKQMKKRAIQEFACRYY